MSEFPVSKSDLLESQSTLGAIGQGVSLYSMAAIVCALAERGAVDPLRVVAWLEFFSTLPTAAVPRETRDAIKSGLQAAADALRSMATKPAAGPKMKQ